MVSRIIVGAVLVLMIACAQEEGQPDHAATIDDLALRYLHLELSMGEHDPDHVDAYFGPKELRVAANNAALSLDAIASKSGELATELQALETKADQAIAARAKGLLARLLALDLYGVQPCPGLSSIHRRHHARTPAHVHVRCVCPRVYHP